MVSCSPSIHPSSVTGSRVFCQLIAGSSLMAEVTMQGGNLGFSILFKDTTCSSAQPGAGNQRPSDH